MISRFYDVINNCNQTIKIMKHSLLLIHPQAKDSTHQKQENIFEKARLGTTLPAIHKSVMIQRQSKAYDFVGPTEFKLRKFFQSQDHLQNKQKPTQYQNDSKQQNFQQQATREFSKHANTTINRETIFSKLIKHEQFQATKQKRNISRHKDYQSYWENQSRNLKQLINKKQPSLVEINDKVLVEDNPDKLDIINNYIVHYWEMSLRNHNPILKRHIKGHRYGEVELEEKLQMGHGIKQVEGSIPRLPLQMLKKVQTKQLALTGRSKSVMESKSMTDRSKFPFSNKEIINQEEVYMINYEGDKKWQGTENFY